MLGVVLVRGYLGRVLHELPYITGGDLYDHAVMANLTLTEGSGASYMTYPRGFHVLTAVMSRLTGLEPLELFAYVTPSFPLLTTLACYTLAHRLLGRTYAMATAFFTGLVLNIPWTNVIDSMYADQLAAQFTLVLMIAALGSLLISPSPRTGFLVALLGSTVVLYHSISSLILGMFLALVSVTVLPYLFLSRKNRSRGWYLFFSLALLGALSIVYAWAPYDLPRMMGAVLGLSEQGQTAQYSSRIVGDQPPRWLVALPTIISQSVVWLGLLGALLLLLGLRSIRPPQSLAAGLILAWLLVLFASSRTSLTGVPVRLNKEMGLPLAVLAALGFVTILRSVVGRHRSLKAMGAALVSLVLVLTVGQSLAFAGKPSPLLLMTDDFAAAGDWLRAHNEGGSIITSPYINGAMLAMSGYSTLQSVPESQLDNPRLLEPRFQAAASDVLYVYKHPDDERTREILAGHDVCYVVLHKRRPKGSLWASWRDNGIAPPHTFARETDLYRRVYENREVIIFEVGPQPGRSSPPREPVGNDTLPG